MFMRFADATTVLRGAAMPMPMAPVTLEDIAAEIAKCEHMLAETDDSYVPSSLVSTTGISLPATGSSSNRPAARKKAWETSDAVVSGIFAGNAPPGTHSTAQSPSRSGVRPSPSGRDVADRPSSAAVGEPPDLPPDDTSMAQPPRHIRPKRVGAKGARPSDANPKQRQLQDTGREERIERLALSKRALWTRRAQEKEQRAQAELKNCTFKPQLNPGDKVRKSVAAARDEDDGLALINHSTVDRLHHEADNRLAVRQRLRRELEIQVRLPAPPQDIARTCVEPQAIL